MGNYMRAARELPKLRRQLEEITQKRIQAERNLQIIREDLERKSQVLERHRQEAIASSSSAVEGLRKEMDAELKAVQEENKKLEKLLQKRTILKGGDDDDEDDDKPNTGAAGRRRQ